MTITRGIGRLAAAATLATTVVSVLVVAGPATAAPSGCNTGRSTGNTTWAACSSGTGQYRAYTWCDAFFARDYKRYGPWLSPGQGRSIAACNSSDYAYDYGYATLS
ncbi:hypothetical protein [Paractinoplanes maris]|uniref:hypothetical protein n=1 Tax=Paractinoplanes maris TaxID=1734446 RepID=UPI00202232E2|nr:hypothetical protein [Actinoplanes maris]